MKFLCSSCSIELTKNDYYYLNEPNKYAEVYLRKDLPTYEKISFFITICYILI